MNARTAVGTFVLIAFFVLVIANQPLPTTAPGLGVPILTPVARRRVLPAPVHVQAKCMPTDPVSINAHFSDTNSDYWALQWKHMHNGVDYGGNPGQAVYAPYNMLIEAIDYYGDAGRIGWFIQSRLDDHYLYYSGHLGSVLVKVGDYAPACTQIGTIGEVFHMHVKIASPDKPVPCEATGCDDPEAYFETH